VKNESSHGKKFELLLKKIRRRHRVELPDLSPVDQLIIGFLEWNATARLAAKAHEQLMAELVDNNDLRVSLPQELLALIGAKYPQGDERVSRLREVLNAIYAREHSMSLDSLAGKPKKQIRAYVEELPGITQYVAAQLMLLGFGVHAMPVDDHIAGLLRAEEVVDPNASVQEVAQFIERRVKAGDAAEAHRLLRVWADVRMRRSAAARAPRKKTAKKKTRKAAPRTKATRKK